MDAAKVIKYPLSTEKSIRLMQNDNKMVFIVDRNATKTEVKGAVEELFGVKVAKVNTFITPDGKKKAFVKFAGDTLAIDLATQLGML